MNKKSTNHRKLKTIIVLTLTALALVSSRSSRGDAQCNWYLPTNWTHNGTGDWFDSSNWDDGVPDCPFPTSIPNGGTAVISSTTQTAQACETFVSYNGGSGYLIVDGGTLHTCNQLHVGSQATGTLTIKNAGSVTTTNGADIGASTGSIGGAKIDGTSSKWTIAGGSSGTLYVAGIGAAGGTGVLTVTNGGIVQVGSVHVYAPGTLTGNGTVSAPNGTTVEGTLAPTGQLTISGDLLFSGHSASLECNVTPASADNVSVSGQATLTGARISVTMTGTTFTAGSTYTLLHAAGGLNSTTFSINSIKGGSGDCFTPTITYDYPNDNVKLYLQPCN